MSVSGRRAESEPGRTGRAMIVSGIVSVNVWCAVCGVGCESCCCYSCWWMTFFCVWIDVERVRKKKKKKRPSERRRELRPGVMSGGVE